MKYSHFKTLARLLALLLLSALAGCSSSGTSSDHQLVDDTPDNTAPVTDAGPDQHIKTSSIITLDGSASSDADHDPLTYEWIMTPKPDKSSATLSGANTSHLTFTADVWGAYNITLTVSDDKGGISAPDTVTVTTAGPDCGLAWLCMHLRHQHLA